MCHPRNSGNALEDRVFGSFLSLNEEDLRISRESLDSGCLTFSWQVSGDYKFDKDVYTLSLRVNFP